METSCHLDGTLFPFDSQSCSIIVQSWAYSEAFIDLRNASEEVHLEEFEGNGKDMHYTKCVKDGLVSYYMDKVAWN